MTKPRPIDLLDLPMLYRLKNDALALDSSRLLSRGNPLGAVGLMAYLNPRRHIYSALVGGDMPVVGGIIHTLNENTAKLLYLAPQSDLDNPAMPGLIEHLAAEAGTWGAHHVIAEVDESSDAYRALRLAGFSVYAWQRMWDISGLLSSGTGAWQRADDVHLPAIQSLYHQIVPALMAAVESMPRRASGLVCLEGTRCFVGMSYGMYGIVLNPLIHPEAADVSARLASLPSLLPDRRKRPVYLSVRSYQAWLEPVLEDLGAKPSERQAVMVKHLARMVKDEQVVKNAEPAWAKPATPMTRAQTRRK